MSTILSIDPSINQCGWAVFTDNKLRLYGLLSSELKDADYIEKSRAIFARIKTNAKKYKVDVIVLEVPEHFGVSGYIARESGSIFKLTFLCGMICSLDNVVTTPPRGWKGQLPKEVMRNRYIKEWPQLDIANMDHNTLDAIGIGRWYANKKVKVKQ